MKPNCQEPIGETFHSVYLSACCASDILILNVFLFNNHIIKGERINYLKKEAAQPNVKGNNNSTNSVGVNGNLIRKKKPLSELYRI